MVKKKRQTDAFADGSSTDSSEETTMQSPTVVGYCQHIKKSVDTAKLRKNLKSSGVLDDCMLCRNIGQALSEANANDENAGFDYDNSLWLCLKCGTQYCGRSKNQHALQHFKTPHSDSHALAMNTQSFLIWCYECDKEVKLETRKFLHECVDIIKRFAQKKANTALEKPPEEVSNIENKILATWESIRPLVNSKDDNTLNNKVVLPLPPIPPPPPTPGAAAGAAAAQRAEQTSKFGSWKSGLSLLPTRDNSDMNNTKQLPRVRGLTNMGNTCFFNAVLQCLAQTPYLLDVLKESAEPGEE